MVPPFFAASASKVLAGANIKWGGKGIFISALFSWLGFLLHTIGKFPLRLTFFSAG